MPRKARQIPVFLFDILGGGCAQPVQGIPVMSNWLKIHEFIRRTPATREGMRTVAKLMVAEYGRKPGPRMDIITRLYGRLNAIRYEVERVEIGL